jgi:ParB family transcriptional regulator, chromosome partitioning protein
MNPRNRGLGRGLSALLGENLETASNSKLPLESLQAGRFQPRKRFDDQSLEELVHSIRAQGVLQPLVVRPLNVSGQYEILAGERRFRASQMAGLTEVPVVITKVDDQQALAISLIENMQREDLTPIEEAQGISRLIEEFHFTHERAAEAVGRSRTATTNLLRLLTLPRAVQEMLQQGELEMGHARAILGAPANQQVNLANKVHNEGLSVRKTEWLARHITKPQKPRATTARHADLHRLEQVLAEHLAAKVLLQANAKGAGALTVYFASLDELDGLLARLGLQEAL